MSYSYRNIIKLPRSVQAEQLVVTIVQCYLCRALSTGLVLRDQDHGPAVGRFLCDDELIEGHVCRNCRSLEMPKYYYAQQVAQEDVVVSAVPALRATVTVLRRSAIDLHIHITAAFILAC